VTPVGSTPDSIRSEIEELWSLGAEAALPPAAADTVARLVTALEAGEVRAATRDSDGRWSAVPWVKQGILLAFRAGHLTDMSPTAAPDRPFSFIDKHTLPARRFDVKDGVRMVPGGSSARRGAHIAPGVVCMPPVFINVGAWIASGTMVDSHVLVGSCAQIGERVHLSAAAQVGGVLEPVNAVPVVVEDDVVVGGNCGVYEGTVVRSGAVLGAGVILTRGTPVFDLVRERVYRAGSAGPLEIPANAVVVPGSRAVKSGWGNEQGLALATPVIVKYRDEKTDLSTLLEGWLR
jgi:2,3,4,5-tetrahydropyridine-2-carboxylate N-succinyltransferase